jgi:hypothetical protein
VQLNKVLYKWFTGTFSKGKRATGPTATEKAVSFYNEMQIGDKYTLSVGSHMKQLARTSVSTGTV